MRSGSNVALRILWSGSRLACQTNLEVNFFFDCLIVQIKLQNRQIRSVSPELKLKAALSEDSLIENRGSADFRVFITIFFI